MHFSNSKLLTNTLLSTIRNNIKATQMFKKLSYKFPIQEDLDLFEEHLTEMIGEKKFQKILLSHYLF